MQNQLVCRCAENDGTSNESWSAKVPKQHFSLLKVKVNFTFRNSEVNYNHVFVCADKFHLKMINFAKKWKWTEDQARKVKEWSAALLFWKVQSVLIHFSLFCKKWSKVTSHFFTLTFCKKWKYLSSLCCMKTENHFTPLLEFKSVVLCHFTFTI